tara:strand:- start:10878 stop:11621 length:744 start_codon:yes stop_codon:yes gene_type:complete
LKSVRASGKSSEKTQDHGRDSNDGAQKGRQKKSGRLTRGSIIESAMAQADSNGIHALSMRKLAGTLGVEAMSLYHHISSREVLLDLMVDRVFEEMTVGGPEGQNWKSWLVALSSRMRTVLIRHPWAVGLLDSRRNPGPGTLSYQNARLGGLRNAGFSMDLAAHAIALQDSFVYGYVVQELALPFEDGEVDLEELQGFQNAMQSGEYPYLQEMVDQVVSRKDYSFHREWDYGMKMLLAGLESQFEQSK